MKTKLMGWLLISGSPIFFFGFLVLFFAPLLFHGGLYDNLTQPIEGIASLVGGVYAFILGSGIKSHKRWSWYVGTVTSVLLTAASIVLIITSLSIFLVIGVLIDAFYIYALTVEKPLFFKSSIPPQMQSPYQTQDTLVQ